MIELISGGLKVSGPITFDSVSALLPVGIGPVTQSDCLVDLSGVTQADSAGLALLLAWQRAAVAAQKQLQWQSAPLSLVSLAQLYGVATWFGFNPVDA